ncbi:MAG: hypothetical protein IJ298_00695 [Ruminococcus sp.]|nr:hypothetical protein [Ruminococcus sp.]
MKDYNEMADAVFRRRDEYLAAKKKHAAILLKAGASVCALLLVAVVGISVWRALPQIPSQKPTEPTVTASINVTETKDNITTEPETATAQEDTKANSEATKKPVVATDPVESTPAGNTDKPQTETTLPPDPTEPSTEYKGDKPATDGSVDPTSATEGPNAPGMDSFPGWTPGTMPQTPATQAPTAGDDRPVTTEAPCTTAVCCTIPGLDETLPGYTDGVETTTTEPTEPPTGPLYLECDGKTYEAQVGDMVTLTVELQADELIKSANVIAKYDYYYGRLEVVNLKELGFTEKQFRNVHAPNMGDALTLVSYNSGTYGRYRAVKLDFVATENEFAVDFTEPKVLLTFSFIVKKTGNTKVELVPNKIVSVNDTEYYRNGNQVVDEGVELDAYLTITPASEVVLPTPPAEEVKPEEIPFTYPQESTDGELIINCDGRIYSANVGDTVTFVTELKADEMFINIHVALDYPEEYLNFNVPQKGKQAFPNMYGMTYNFEGYKDSATGEVINPAVIMVATDIYGFDFTSRQVLSQLEFEVIKAGEIDLDLHFEDMFKYAERGKEEPYFELGVQKSFDDIYIYDYVLVEDKSSQ